MQTKRMRGNAEGFVASAKQVAYCKLLGLPLASAYRQPDSFTKKSGEVKTPATQTKTVSAEGGFDLTKFNG